MTIVTEQNAVPLGDEQVRFFETFGYLVLRGALRDDIGWVTEEFEAVFAAHRVQHDGASRSMVASFIDQRPRLAALLDHPVVEGTLTSLLGNDFNYCSGDGNCYAGDTPWHADGNHLVGRFVKLALYLDTVTRDTGCLRVIPGTHRVHAIASRWEARDAGRSEELWGTPLDQVPAVALESQPGDVVLFDHNIMHASFGGAAKRRMFTLNCTARAESAAEVEELKAYLALHTNFGMERMHSDIMRETASPNRRRHLEQPIEHEWVLRGTRG